MEYIITQILKRLRQGKTPSHRELARITQAALRRTGEPTSHYAKHLLAPYYWRVKNEDKKLWQSWEVTPALERQLLSVLRMKPRRTASGVATITVITKPWACSGNCVFCPSDVRMPKSYLHKEPACMRAERNFFDPYLQVRVRLAALYQMGHATDKIELIVLGGTWSDYPQAYQLWFVREMLRALNDAGACPGIDDEAFCERRGLYEKAGFLVDDEALRQHVCGVQDVLNAGALSYNEALRVVYGGSAAWRKVAGIEEATFDQLDDEQRINETALHRVVGLTVETRPDAVSPRALGLIRRLGVTNVQMGVQSLNQRILDLNGRGIRVESIVTAFELLRIFGFKIHVHAMVNLLGATPADDEQDYLRLVSDAAFQPDEIKLYPCALIESAPLVRNYEDGSWRPYAEDVLISLLSADLCATPAFCRISRMVRDFACDDIMAGNKKPNLRQLIGERMARSEGACGAGQGSEGRSRPCGAGGAGGGGAGGGGAGLKLREIRSRELALDDVDVKELSLEIVSYQTTNTNEHFLQWLTPDGRIVGFLRLSLPDEDYVRAHADQVPIKPGEAMIRELHIYGTVSRLGERSGSAQHRGLGRALVERACGLAREAGYRRMNVICSVGARIYMRGLGFKDHGLYQQRMLM